MKVTGKYRVEGFDLNDKKIYDKTFHNIVVQSFFTGVFKFLNQAISGPDVDSLNLTHMATGTGTTTPSKSDTSLANEQFRKQLSSKAYSADTFTCKLSLLPSESNFTITEIGIFAAGTDTIGTGTLISRFSANIEKNANIKYLITYTMTIN